MTEDITEYAKQEFWKLINSLNDNSKGIVFEVKHSSSNIIIYATKENKKLFMMMANGYVKAHRKLADLYAMISISAMLTE